MLSIQLRNRGAVAADSSNKIQIPGLPFHLYLLQSSITYHFEEVLINVCIAKLATVENVSGTCAERESVSKLIPN